MILPGMTISPPNFLTPRRLPRLSRPLRDEPPAFLCAICYPFRRRRTVRAFDVHDPQYGLLLAMPLLAPVVVPPLLLEDDDLSRPRLLDHRGADASALEQRVAGRNLGPFADHQHLVELDGRTLLRREFFHRDDVVLDDPVLFAAGPNYSEHHNLPIVFRSTRATGSDARANRSGLPPPRAAQYRPAIWSVNGVRGGFDWVNCDL